MFMILFPRIVWENFTFQLRTLLIISTIQRNSNEEETAL